MDLKNIYKDVESVTKELLEAAELNSKEGVVLGGSTSEIIGQSLGQATNLEVAQSVVEAFYNVIKDNGLSPIIQACEHINRALVVERDYALNNNLEIVNVIPVETAGGGFATSAMKIFKDPVVVENVNAKAGIDIGDVFIGMHIKGVGVVVRSEIKEIGKAHLSMIRTRPKLIGGARAKYY